jgi:hypothetical protein
VWGWWAQLLSRGCGGAAAFSREGPGVRPEVCARDCAAMCSFQAEYGPSVDHLPSRQSMGPLCIDPLLCSGFARLRVLLYWQDKSCTKGPEPIACGNVIPDLAITAVLSPAA